MTAERSASTVLSEGLSATLDVWREQLGGEDDALYWTLRMKLAQTEGGVERVLRNIPNVLAGEVLRAHRAINHYFDNIRYALLDPLTQVWGTLVNALRVAAQVDSVTTVQQETFRFEVAELVRFFQAAHQNMALCDQLHHAFRPMPAPDCQMLAALFNVHIDLALREDALLKLVRLLS